MSLFRVLIVGKHITGPRVARVFYAEQKPGASCPVEQSLLDVTKTVCATGNEIWAFSIISTWSSNYTRLSRSLSINKINHCAVIACTGYLVHNAMARATLIGDFYSSIHHIFPNTLIPVKLLSYSSFQWIQKTFNVFSFILNLYDFIPRFSRF